MSRGQPEDVRYTSPHAFGCLYFNNKDVFDMNEIEAYVERLKSLGYSLGDAAKIVNNYASKCDLDALEDYIYTKETVAEVIG